MANRVPTQRPKVLIGLLVLVLVFMLALSWQAFRTMQTHDETATSVLRGYARLVIDEYTRRAMASVGYYGYYTAINELRVAVRENPDFSFAKTATMSEIVGNIVGVDVRAGNVHSTRQLDASRRDFLVQRSRELVNQPLPESGLVIEHVEINGEPLTYVLSFNDAGDRVFGFETDQAAVTERLGRVPDDGPLLPRSLADDRVGNDRLFLRHVDGTGSTLFSAGADPDPYLLATRTLGDEYSGIYRGHVISAALDKDLAELVIIGGLPRSRLPLLMTLVVLTLVLLVAVLRQLRREYAVMQLRNDFVAEVSHELRTPLTQIRMFAETLLHGRARTDDDRRRAVEIVNREAQRLSHLVENVLLFSRTEKADARLEPVRQPLGPVVGSVVDEFEPIAAAADMSILVSGDTAVEATIDQDAIRQVLLNLLDNAVKYGPAGQAIGVTIDGAQGHVGISVCDEGPGIPAEHRAEVLEPYRRLQRERDAAIAGTGIGLSVVSEIVERHGGRIRIDTARDGGACFVIELPR